MSSLQLSRSGPRRYELHSSLDFMPLDCYALLAPVSAKDYDLVKAAILKRSDVSPKTYRKRFCTQTRKLSPARALESDSLIT